MDREAHGLLPAGRGHRLRRGVSVLLRHRHQPEIGDRPVPGRSVADDDQPRQLPECADRRQLRAQLAELAVRLRRGGCPFAVARRHIGLCAGAHSIPRPLGPAVHHPVGVDVPAGGAAGRAVRTGPPVRPLQFAVRADLLLHDLHLAVHRLGAHHLRPGPAGRGRGGGDPRRRDAVDHRHPGLPAADVAGAGEPPGCWPSSARGTSSCLP